MAKVSSVKANIINGMANIGISLRKLDSIKENIINGPLDQGMMGIS
ncbi:MAG: hypothetical protein ACKO63_14720 [Nodosilinea sp.]